MPGAINAHLTLMCIGMENGFREFRKSHSPMER